ncbi:MAG: polysaccharide deacetylase family protein [Betaproteobacteria bacterium]|nr:polysaccharide deacetylase family protein [Betaproteobacteria bacterium]
MPRPWNPTPLIKTSALLHVAAGGAVVLQPAAWPWALGALVADHLTITAAGLLPRCQWLGQTLTRLPAGAVARGEISLTIDDGPDPEVTPRVLDLLAAHGARASFFCIGHRARQFPEVCREIVARGHSVENHGQQHSRAFALHGPRGMKKEIVEGMETLGAITGVAPRFFRPPAGLRNPFLDPVLARLDLRLAAWSRRGYDTRDGDAESVGNKLLAGLAAGDILLLHDGNAARTAAGQAVILDVLPRLLDRLDRASLRSVTLPEAFDER